MKYSLTLLCLLSFGFAHSQYIIGGHTIPSNNFYTIKQYINDSLRKTEGITHDEEESEGDHLYDRWINYWQDRINPDGSMPAADQNYNEVKRYRQAHSQSSRSATIQSDWQEMNVHFASRPPGLGRVDRIAFNPYNVNHLYISTPSGSFWESYDAGTTWRSRTDQLPVIGLAGIVIDPQDTNIIYIATGDGEANADNPSIGVLKSYDGGSTWQNTGISYNFAATTRYLSRIEMSSTDHLSLLVAAKNGIFLTHDSGATFATKLTGNFKDVKYMPGNGAVCYAVSTTAFYRSIDSGNTWNRISSGLPTSGMDRISIAVTPAASAKVYLIYGGTAGLIGVYASSDTGNTFSTLTTSPNILGLTANGSDNFSQSWYTLALAVSPIDPNIIYAGAGNVWRTTNGGSSWSCQSCGGNNGGRTHVDIHELRFKPDGSGIYSGNDGGLYYRPMSGSTAWTYLSDGLQSTQIYRIAVSETDTNIVMYGAQDNDIVLYNTGTWDGSNLNADGFGCAIDPTNSNTIFGSSQNGGLAKSTNKGIYWSNLTVGNQDASWDSPYKMNMLNSNELWAGMDYMYHTTNGGATWTRLGALGSSTHLFKNFGVCESNTDVMYATYTSSGSNGLYKSTDGGVTWAYINSPDLSSLIINAIEVHPSDPDQLWVTVGGYRAGNKVFYSNDGGSSFNNISYSLPNLSANTVVYQKNTPGMLYVGMDNGVYVIDDTIPDWQPFYTNLPNVIVKELKIRYATSELFAGTYGRGIWRTPLYQSTRSASGISDLSKADLAIYPNPVTDELMIDMSGAGITQAQIIITDAAGHEIKQVYAHTDKTTISCGDLASGIYIVSIEVNGSKAVRKFVKM